MTILLLLLVFVFGAGLAVLAYLWLSKLPERMAAHRRHRVDNDGSAVAAGQCGDSRQSESATDFQHAQARRPRFRQNNLGEHSRRGPQIGPVGQVLVRGECRVNRWVIQQVVISTRLFNQEFSRADDDALALDVENRVGRGFGKRTDLHSVPQ